MSPYLSSLIRALKAGVHCSLPTLQPQGSSLLHLMFLQFLAISKLSSPGPRICLFIWLESSPSLSSQRKLRLLPQGERSHPSGASAHSVFPIVCRHVCLILIFSFQLKCHTAERLPSPPCPNWLSKFHSITHCMIISFLGNNNFQFSCLFICLYVYCQITHVNINLFTKVEVSPVLISFSHS